MGKYKEENFVNKAYGFEISDELRFCLINELAEANRLKRLEIKINNLDVINEQKALSKELEDQA